MHGSPAVQHHLTISNPILHGVTKIQQRKSHVHDGIIFEVLAHTCLYSEEGQDWFSLFLATGHAVVSSYHLNLQSLPITWTCKKAYRLFLLLHIFSSA